MGVDQPRRRQPLGARDELIAGFGLRLAGILDGGNDAVFDDDVGLGGLEPVAFRQEGQALADNGFGHFSLRYSKRINLSNGSWRLSVDTTMSWKAG